jgi:hypothetical protein
MLNRIGDFVGRVADRRSTIFLTASVVMVVFGCFDYFTDMAMLSFGVAPELHAAGLAMFVGVGAGFSALVLLMARRERRRMVQDELYRLAELNHRLRNSLQIIAYAHYTSEDESHRKMMMDAVSSIDTSLRQLIPAMGVDHRKQEYRP